MAFTRRFGTVTLTYYCLDHQTVFLILAQRDVSIWGITVAASVTQDSLGLVSIIKSSVSSVGTVPGVHGDDPVHCSPGFLSQFVLAAAEAAVAHLTS